MKIIVTPSAQTDMQNIFDYIASDNKKKAIEIIDNFEQQFDYISLYPYCGVKKNKFFY